MFCQSGRVREDSSKDIRYLKCAINLTKEQVRRNEFLGGDDRDAFVGHLINWYVQCCQLFFLMYLAQGVKCIRSFFLTRGALHLLSFPGVKLHPPVLTDLSKNVVILNNYPNTTLAMKQDYVFNHCNNRLQESVTQSAVRADELSSGRPPPLEGAAARRRSSCMGKQLQLAAVGQHQNSWTVERQPVRR